MDGISAHRRARLCVTLNVMYALVCMYVRYVVAQRTRLTDRLAANPHGSILYTCSCKMQCAAPCHVRNHNDDEDGAVGLRSDSLATCAQPWSS